MWGVFPTEESVHVVPVDKDERPLEPHELDDFCICSPKVTFMADDGRYLVIHEHIN